LEVDFETPQGAGITTPRTRTGIPLRYTPAGDGGRYGTIMKIRKNITCPLELTHDVIKGKWKPIIIWNLKEKQSLSSLKRSINGISEKMLLEHLKELMEFKIVDKTTFSGYPLKVEYYLTERGKDLLTAIIIMQKIGTNIQAELEE
jgi:DNA-binding HxlR family transcriptional regulator